MNDNNENPKKRLYKYNDRQLAKKREQNKGYRDARIGEIKQLTIEVFYMSQEILELEDEIFRLAQHNIALEDELNEQRAADMAQVLMAFTPKQEPATITASQVKSVDLLLFQIEEQQKEIQRLEDDLRKANYGIFQLKNNSKEYWHRADQLNEIKAGASVATAIPIKDKPPPYSKKSPLLDSSASKAKQGKI